MLLVAVAVAVLLVRWDKKPQNYLANLKLACALLWFRRAYQAGSTLLG